jgi:hypothetical protein
MLSKNNNFAMRSYECFQSAYRQTYSYTLYIFWDIKLWSLLKVDWRFGETYRLFLRDSRLSHLRNHHEARGGVVRGSLFSPEDGGDIVLRNWVDFNWATRCYIFEDGTLHNQRCGCWIGWLVGWLVYSCSSQLEHRASVKRFVSLQFLNLRHSVGLLGRVIRPSQVRYLTQTQNKHRHLYLEWDSNPQSQLSGERRQFMP